MLWVHGHGFSFFLFHFLFVICYFIFFEPVHEAGQTQTVLFQLGFIGHYSISNQKCLFFNQLHEFFGRKTLWSFDRHTKSSIHDQLWQHPKCSCNTKQNGVEASIGQSVIL